MLQQSKVTSVPASRRLAFLMCTVSLALASCATQSSVDRLRDEMRDILAMTSCTVADRELFDRLRAECPPETAASCKTQQLLPALRRHGGLEALFRGQKFRVAFYPHHNFKSLPSFRLNQLERLVRGGPIFDTTRFVVVARTDPGESARESDTMARSQLVVKHLKEYLSKSRREDSADDDEPASSPSRGTYDKMIWRWRYDEKLKVKDMDEMDRPQDTIGEPQNLNRGVWVFRVDC